MSSSTSLRGTVGKETAQVTWEWKANEPEAQWNTLGTSTNLIYVTYSWPHQDAILYHTVNVFNFDLVTVAVAEQVTGDTRLVIKNWEQNNAGTQPDPFKWRIETEGECFEMVPAPGGNGDYGDLTSTNGINGQPGSTPSQKVFGAHFIINSWDDDLYYDPSSGVVYTDEDDMETVALYGFATDCVEDNGGLFADVRMATGSGGVWFSQ